MAVWKPTTIQAKHIAVNRLLIEAGWLIGNSRKGMAYHMFDGGEGITWRFSDAERDAMFRGSRAVTPEEARRMATYLI